MGDINKFGLKKSVFIGYKIIADKRSWNVAATYRRNNRKDLVIELSFHTSLKTAIDSLYERIVKQKVMTAQKAVFNIKGKIVGVEEFSVLVEEAKEDIFVVLSDLEKRISETFPGDFRKSFFDAGNGKTEIDLFIKKRE